ncbi:MAG: hypothetical protein HY659_13565 [Rhizobiales bacterium]|nr:hypothetical protein [Hyphomicrobiales bacterium]
MRFRLDDIFPISDAPSARLMKIKAMCLLEAGVISAAERSEIDRRADREIARERRAPSHGHLRAQRRRDHRAGGRRAA